MKWPFVSRTRYEEMRERKDGAYLERNQVVAALARLALTKGHRVGLKRTAIEGWSSDWHGCLYMDLPTGQVSWHYNDAHAHLFAGLPAYEGDWDGHETPVKYERLNEAFREDVVVHQMAAKVMQIMGRDKVNVGSAAKAAKRARK